MNRSRWGLSILLWSALVMGLCLGLAVDPAPVALAQAPPQATATRPPVLPLPTGTLTATPETPGPEPVATETPLPVTAAAQPLLPESGGGIDALWVCLAAGGGATLILGLRKRKR